MIEVSKAIEIIEANSRKMQTKLIPISKALGYVLAEKIISPINMPPFRQSAMDGYAFTHSIRHQYDVVGTSQAGDHSNIKLKATEAIRIFTGAYVPDDADTVVMQEHVMANENSILIATMPDKLSNVRPKGEQIAKDDIVFEANTLITPAAIGFLACLGITEVEVYKKPKVAILVTGNELVQPGKKLKKEKYSKVIPLCLKLHFKQLEYKKRKFTE